MTTRSDLFNWSRWCLLVSKHWTENRKPYTLALLGSAGLLLTWFSFILLVDKFTPLNVLYQYMTYFIGLYITGTLYASTLFAALSSRREGISFLTLPASHLEKLLCSLLFGILLFFVAYTLVFYAVDIPMVRLANRLIEKIPRNYPNTSIRVEPNPVYNVFSGNYGPVPEKNFHTFLLGFFSVQSAFLLGSVYFTRYSFIKVVIALGLVLLAAVVIQSNVIWWFLPKGWSNGGTEWYTRAANGDLEKLVQLPAAAETAVIRLLQWGPPVLFCIITYFRLKEKQV